MTPILDTERLHLRPLAPRDAEALFAIMSDPQAMRFWDWPPFREVQTVREIVASQMASMQAGAACYWAVCLKGTGAAIGTCDLSDIDRHHGRAEVGFAFHRSYWGNGFALEAMKAVIAHACGAMAIERLGARLHAGNDASRRLLERLDFRYEGRLVGHVVRDGRRRDCLLYGRLASD
jgi:ribosomal-protein-alanine N-acetyltransferase